MTATTKVQVEYELVDRLTGPSAKVNAAIDGTTSKLTQAENPVQSFGNSWTSLATKLLAAGALMKAGQYLYDFGKGSIMAASQIETYKTSLVNMLGTQEAANKRMAEYQDIAQKTPFELPQVVEAGNQLQALGKYSRENVVMLGDLASASGKPIEQAMSAYAKMATGQKGIAVDMFRDLMITADDWQKATGKGISKNGELLASTTELLAVIPTILKKKGFAGMMESQSKTTAGMASNMKDAYFQMQATIGQRFIPEVQKGTMALTEMFSGVQKLFEYTKAEQLEFKMADVNKMVAEMTDINTPYERRLELYNQLKKIQPEIIKNYKLEKNNVDDLNISLEAFNQKTIQQLVMEKSKEKIQDLLDDANDIRKKGTDKSTDVVMLVTSLLTNASKLKDAGMRKDVVSELTKINKNPYIYTKTQDLTTYIGSLKGSKFDQINPNTGKSALSILFENTGYSASTVGNANLDARKANDFYKKSNKLKAEYTKQLNLIYSSLGMKPESEGSDIVQTNEVTNPPNDPKNPKNKNGDKPNNEIFSADPTTSSRATSITIKVDKIVGIENLNTKEIKEATPVIEREIIGAVVRGLNSANGM